MRIVAGRWRGRHLDAPKGTSTRPTSDRVREALFSSLASRLGPDLGGAIVLDAYAGTGALGLEALSRGAERATFVEAERRALDTLGANVRALAEREEARIVPGDVVRLASAGGLPGGPFTLLFLDPPYRIDAARVRQLLETLADSNSLVDGAIVVWEHASAGGTEWPGAFEVLFEKRYGSTSVSVAVFGRGETE